MCSTLDERDLDLAEITAPFFNTHGDVEYACRLTGPRASWNTFASYSLYPMTISKLNRVLIIASPTVDLYPVFDSETEL